MTTRTGLRGRLAAMSRDNRRRLLVFGIVFVLALLRQPMAFLFEETTDFWPGVPTFDPSGGYLQLFARFTFVVAHPFGPVIGLLVTRVIAAAVVASVAVYLASLQDAIPSRTVRLVLALSLPLFPVLAGWGPYLGPLNSPWWFALAAVGISLARPRAWHYPFLLLAGLSGVTVCAAWPAFRDRRAVPLLVASAIQVAVLFSGPKLGHLALHIDAVYMLLVAGVVLLLANPALPLRTRLAFGYLALAHIALGAILSGVIPGNDRYVTMAWATLFLGAAALVLRVVRRVDLGVADAPRHDAAADLPRPVPHAPPGLLQDA